ncbi:MAG: hypothetical protein K0Q76_4192 [Panacagrimonas sp.]|nr:hypothetical protein [Panacagrimonas sp.]
MRCETCERLIGLRSAHHPHAHLSAPGAAGTKAYPTQAFQKAYVCSQCRSVLIRGKNTGWVAGELEPAVVAAPVEVAQ